MKFIDELKDREILDGFFDAHGLVMSLPRHDVESALPSSLELAHDFDEALIYFSIGRQMIGPRLLPLAGSYHEALFSIPHVRHVGYPDWGEVSYMPVMYIDRLIALAANHMYGFRKKHASIRVARDEFEIRAPFGKGRIRLRFEDHDQAKAPDEFMHMATAPWTFPALSFLGSEPLLSKLRFHHSELIRPSRVEAEFDVPEMPWLPHHITLPGISGKAGGGFATVQQYSLGAPRRLRKQRPDHGNRWPGSKKRRLAILGGGVGAITAAYAITSIKDWDKHFDITLYQMGWRLGGKGASGRNADCGQRIQEHGLHLWAGFYDNAFRLFRDCYHELLEAGLADGIFKSWRDAFTPQNVYVQNEHVDGEWMSMPAAWPENDAEPGSSQEYLEPHEYFHMLLAFLEQAIHGVPDDAMEAGAISPEARQLAGELRNRTGHLPRKEAPRSSGLLDELMDVAGDTEASVAHEVFSRLRSDAGKNPIVGYLADHVLGGIDDLLAHLQQRLVDRRDAVGQRPEALRSYYMVSVAVAVARGLINENVLRGGFEAIDHYDLREFLAEYGAPDEVLASAIVRGGYDYTFAFEDGDIDKARLAAGVAVRGAMRVFLTYKGALMWKMNAGMGDTIFTPYYKMLKARGVKFEFFSKVRNLGVDGGRIATIDMEQQATVKEACRPYQPFVRVGAIDCWPDRPDFDQLEEGSDLEAGNINLESSWSGWEGKRYTLEAGKDFDDVLLGIAPGAFPYIAPELEKNRRWKKMVETTKTNQTVAMQLWLKPDVHELGWKIDSSICTSYAEIWATWADMSHLIPQEAWKQSPKNIAYFCGVIADADPIPPFTDTAFPAQQYDRVKENGKAWLDENIGFLWPKAIKDGCFDPKLCIADGEYYRINIDPSERYVLSLPGSLRHRLEAGDSGFANLYLAGDWVATSINAGCVEAATVGGLKAAVALTGHDIEINDEPRREAKEKEKEKA